MSVEDYSKEEIIKETKETISLLKEEVEEPEVEELIKLLRQSVSLTKTTEVLKEMSKEPLEVAEQEKLYNKLDRHQDKLNRNYKKMQKLINQINERYGLADVIQFPLN